MSRLDGAACLIGLHARVDQPVKLASLAMWREVITKRLRLP